MNTEDNLRLDVLRRYAIVGTPPEPNFDRITALATRIFGLPACTLSLVDRDRFWFKSRHGVDATEMPRRMAFCEETIVGDDVFVVPDALADARFSNAPVVCGAPGVRFYAGAPLITPDGVCIGSLCVLNTEPQRGFSDSEKAILMDLAATAMELIEARARQLELAECTKEIAHLATHDPLTGLPNRRLLHERMIGLPVRQQVALFYLDLDGFKAVNDRFGHAFGDVLLKQVAKRLTEVVPPYASVARLGGDEFAILLSAGDGVQSDSEVIAQRVIEVLGREFNVGDETVNIGVSAGLALATSESDLDVLLGKADAALYAAKLSGKGCYRLAAHGPDIVEC
jgi:diguanylate cyclase (GGDEF)-like protein